MAPDEVAFRPASEADAEGLAMLAERTFRETYAAFNTPADMDHYVAGHFGPALQRAELSDPAMRTVLAAVDRRAAGYSQLRFGAVADGVTGPAPIELYRFYLDRPWHGTGLARRLMEATRQSAAGAGARTLWLGVWERNGRAIAFYQTSGFRPVGAHTFRLGADLQRDLVLQRPLP